MVVSAFFDSDSKVNAIYPTFTQELRFFIRPTDVEVQKIDSTILDTYGMVVMVFLIIDEANRVNFFKETFLVANISPEVVFGMLFLILSVANIDFLDWKLRWRTYITKETLATTKRVKLVEKKEFAATAFNSKYETFIVHITFLGSATSLSSILLNVVYPSYRH